MWIARDLFEKAEPLAIKTLQVRRLVLGDEHPDTLESMNGLAVLYKEQHVPSASSGQALSPVEWANRQL